MDKQEIRNAIEQKDAMVALTKSQGWEILCKIFEAQVQARSNQVLLQPLGERLDVYTQEFTKGEICALRTFLNMPKALVTQTNELLETLPEGSLE